MEPVLRGDDQQQSGAPSAATMIDLASNWLRSFPAAWVEELRRGHVDAHRSAPTEKNKRRFQRFPPLPPLSA